MRDDRSARVFAIPRVFVQKFYERPLSALPVHIIFVTSVLARSLCK